MAEVALPLAHLRCACAVMYVEEKRQEIQEAEQPQQNFYDTKPEGETVANDDDSYHFEKYNLQLNEEFINKMFQDTVKP